MLRSFFPDLQGNTNSSSQVTSNFNLSFSHFDSCKLLSYGLWLLRFYLNV